MRYPTDRGRFAFPFLLAILVYFAGCAGVPTTTQSSSTTQSSVCSGCQFVYTTTNSGPLLDFPITSTGGLGTPTSIAGPAGSTGLISLSPSGAAQQFDLYVSDPQNRAIRVYTISSADGRLLPASVGPFSLGGVNGTPGEMVLIGAVLYVANSAGSIAAFNVNGDGSLTSVAGSPFAAGTGLSHLAVIPSSTVPNTTFLYAANSGDPNGSISAYSVTPSGRLLPVPGSPFATRSSAGPEGFYSSGQYLYVALQNANAVAAFTIGDDGSLTSLPGSPYPAGRGTFSLNGANGFLFATNNLDGTISSYRLDPSSGILTRVGVSLTTGSVASGDTLYANGNLFVPDASSNNIEGFQTDPHTGEVRVLPGSPFQASAGPLALALVVFPVVNPTGGN